MPGEAAAVPGDASQGAFTSLEGVGGGFLSPAHPGAAIGLAFVCTRLSGVLMGLPRISSPFAAAF